MTPRGGGRGRSCGLELFMHATFERLFLFAKVPILFTMNVEPGSRQLAEAETASQ